eukprot:m.124681 g.124681  ORF g.124681 m.124681 type:complete len:823 (+) comp14653_c5_seq1:1301-3769(+)
MKPPQLGQQQQQQQSHSRVRSARDDPTRRHATMAVLLEELEGDPFLMATTAAAPFAPAPGAGEGEGEGDVKGQGPSERRHEQLKGSESNQEPAVVMLRQRGAVRNGFAVADVLTHAPATDDRVPLIVTSTAATSAPSVASTPAPTRRRALSGYHSSIPLTGFAGMGAPDGKPPATPKLCGSMLGELSDDSDEAEENCAVADAGQGQDPPERGHEDDDEDDDDHDVMISPFKFAARAEAGPSDLAVSPPPTLSSALGDAPLSGADTPTSLAVMQGHLAQRRRPHHRVRVVSSSSEHAMSVSSQHTEQGAGSASDVTSNTASTHEGALPHTATPDVPASRVVSVIEQQKRRKQYEAIQELIDTEEAFLKDLCVIKTIFADNMSPHGGPMQYLISAQDHVALFSNVDDLVSSSSFFLIQLKEAWQQGGLVCDDDTDPNYIGEVFLRNLNCFKLLEVFCCNQAKSLNTLQRLCDTQILFAKWLDACQQRQPECRKMPLSAFLLSPVQRVTKYPLLLERIIAYTPDDDPQKPSLIEAKTLVSQYLQHINEATRIAESDDRMAGLVRMLKEQGDGRIDRWLAASPNHQLVAEGDLRLSQHKRRGFEDVYVYVFSDMLLVTKLGSKASGRLAIDPLPMRWLLIVEDPLPDPPTSVKEQCVFLVEDISSHTQYYFRASAVPRKSYWVQLLRTHALRAGKWCARRGGLADLFLSVAEREEGHFLSHTPDHTTRNGRRNPIVTPWHPSAARAEGMPRGADSRPISTLSLPMPGPAHPSSMYSCNFNLPSPSNTSPSLPRTRPPSGLPLPASLSLATMALSPAPFRASRVSDA